MFNFSSTRPQRKLKPELCFVQLQILICQLYNEFKVSTSNVFFNIKTFKFSITKRTFKVIISYEST